MLNASLKVRINLREVVRIEKCIRGHVMVLE